MCQMIDILDGRELNTIQELIDYLGGEENLIYDKNYKVKPTTTKICLCPIDIERTFKRLGKRVVPTVWGYEEKI